jgi:hypothetical protein
MEARGGKNSNMGKSRGMMAEVERIKKKMTQITKWREITLT